MSSRARPDKLHRVLQPPARSPVLLDDIAHVNLFVVRYPPPPQQRRVPRARYPQHLRLYLPPAVARDVLDPRHERRVRRLGLGLVFRRRGAVLGARQVVAAAGDHDERAPRDRCEDGRPRRQLVGVVGDDERAWREEAVVDAGSVCCCFVGRIGI